MSQELLSIKDLYAHHLPEWATQRRPLYGEELEYFEQRRLRMEDENKFLVWFSEVMIAVKFAGKHCLVNKHLNLYFGNKYPKEMKRGRTRAILFTFHSTHHPYIWILTFRGSKPENIHRVHLSPIGIFDLATGPKYIHDTLYSFLSSLGDPFSRIFHPVSKAKLYDRVFPIILTSEPTIPLPTPYTVSRTVSGKRVRVNTLPEDIFVSTYRSFLGESVQQPMSMITHQFLVQLSATKPSSQEWFETALTTVKRIQERDGAWDVHDTHISACVHRIFISGWLQELSVGKSLVRLTEVSPTLLNVFTKVSEIEYRERWIEVTEDGYRILGAISQPPLATLAECLTINEEE